MMKFKRKLLKGLSKVVSIALSFAMLIGITELHLVSNGDSGIVATAASTEEKAEEVKSSTAFKPLDYTIVLDYQEGERYENGKKYTEDKIEIKSNNRITVNVPEKDGYAFYGFFSERNARGVKYFDENGKMPEDISFTADTPRKLYAAWIKLSSAKIHIDDELTVDSLNSVKYTSKRAVGIDVNKLIDLRYTKMQVDISVNVLAEVKGAGRELKLLIDNKTEWERTNIDLQNTDLQTYYYSATLDLSKFTNSSTFKLGIAQSEEDFRPFARLLFKGADVYFTVIGQEPAEPLTKSEKSLKTNTYVFPESKDTADNKGYNLSLATGGAHPLGSNYVSYSLRYKGGELIGDNGKYGYIADDNFSGGETPNLQLYLKYNFSQTEKINGTDWNVDYSNYTGSVNGISGAGEVGSGVLLVQKSFDGVNYTWENPYTSKETTSFHSSDFVNNYSPMLYNGKEGTGYRIEPVVKKDENGNTIYTYDENGDKSGYEYVKNGDSYAYAETYAPIDGYLPIYQPSGDSLKQGIYIKVLFAYQLSYYTYDNGWDQFWDGFITDTKVWHYANVAEETTLFISNSKAEILFQNMNFTQAEEDSENSADDTVSDLVRDFGNVKDGDAVNDGFKVNYNGNNYDVRYSKNGSGLNDTTNDAVYDGRVFMEPGKYEFTVTPKVGEPKKTTIYINDRGLTQNLNYYFSGNLITKDSQRLFSQIDEIPVYKAGQVSWHVNGTDENHMPVTGRIGLYLETLSKAAFESKYGYLEDASAMKAFNAGYVKLNSKVEVDSNYIIKPDDGFTSYRVKVESGYVPVEGDGYEAYKEPQIIDGKTYVGTIYGSIKLDDGREIVGTIDGFDIYKLVATKDSGRNSAGGKFTECGDYLAQFANNGKYFDSPEQVSGDVFCFYFRFRVSEEANAPEINKLLFDSNFGISDFDSKYYGVKIPNKTTGKIVTFVYFDEGTAQAAAYEYARSLVVASGDGFTFRGKYYDSQFSVQKAVNEYAKSKELLDKGYLNCTDGESCIVYSGEPDKVLTSDKVTHNVLAFDSSIESYYSVVGTPFLNNRVYKYMDAEGEVIPADNPVKFVQISEYESQSVELIYVNGDKEVSYGKIPYGAEVQGYLEAKKAESGKYKIVEKNLYGETVYYGVYLRPGDNRTSIETTRVYNSLSVSQSLSKENANSVFTANSFLIKSAENELDPYGLIKISNNLGLEKTYQLSEVENVKIDARGEWTVSLIDRLGNVVNFYVNIYSPSEIHKLTLNDNGKITSLYVSDGEKVTLHNPVPDNPKYEFIGWEAADGTIYNGSFLFDFTEDTTLTALYRFVTTTVSVYDGIHIDTFETKPAQKLVLPDNLSRPGLQFYGYRYTLDNEDRLCIGQLNSVPNVSELRLDAVYIDKSNSVEVSDGQSLANINKKGYTFYGWGTSDRGSNSYIFTDGLAQFTDAETLTLYPLYIAEEGNAPIIAGSLSSFTDFTGGVLHWAATSFKNGSLLNWVAAVILCAVAALISKKRKNGRVNKPQGNSRAAYFGNGVNGVAAPQAVCATSENGLKQANKNSSSAVKVNFGRRSIKLKTFFTAAVCFLLAVVLGFYATDKLSSSVSSAVRINAQASAIKREYNETVRYSAASDGYSAQDNDDDFNGQETFLYSLVALDLNVKGYDTFEAVVTKENGEKVRGVGFTDWTYINTIDDLEYFKAGFISYTDEAPFGASDFESAVIEQYIEEEEKEYKEPECGFKLQLKEGVWADHYVAFDEYVVYSIDGYRISCISVENSYGNYNLGLGYLYDYDKDEAVYDPDLGKAYDKSGYTLSSSVDYEKIIETYRTIIDYQDSNGVTVETVTFTAIDVSAINEYVLHGQDESYLGISTDEIAFIESQLSTTTFYYIDGVTGQVSVLEIPEIETDDSATIWNILNLVLNVVMIEIGIVLCCTGVGAGLGASLIVGGIVGIVAQYFKDEIGEFINSAIGSDGTQALGGGMSVMMGGVTINIGRNLIGKTGWGTAAGVVCIIIGVALAVFGVSELSEVAFDYNFIKELTGISDKAYANLYQALGYASTVIITVYSTLSQYYKTVGGGVDKRVKLQREFKKRDKAYQRAQKELKRLAEKEYKNYQKILEKAKPYVKDIVENGRYPSPKNKTWKMVESLDNFDPSGAGISKKQLIENGGNGYIVSRKYPDIKVKITNGVPDMGSQMVNAEAFIDPLDTTIFCKSNKMDLFDYQYAKKLENFSKTDRLEMIPDALKGKDFTSKAIEKFRQDSNLVWHEDITGRVMLVPKSINNAGTWRGIPHIGANSVFNTKNVKAITMYETIQKLKKLGVKF